MVGHKNEGTSIDC